MSSRLKALKHLPREAVMASERRLLMGAFVSQFRELCEDLNRVFPEDVDVRGATTAFQTLLTANPKLVLNVYHMHVTLPYQDAFFAGNLAFFLEKDYTDDIRLTNSGAILRKIDALRVPIARLSPECHDSVLKYFSNMCKLTNRLVPAEGDLEIEVSQ